jgi:subtilisin family serine protease
MSRDQDTLLRSVLSLDTPQSVFHDYVSTFVSPTQSMEVLLEPCHDLPIIALPSQQISHIIHTLHGTQIGTLKYFLWLEVPFRNIILLRQDEAYRRDLLSLGIDRVWPNLPLFPQTSNTPQQTAPNIHAMLNTIGFLNPTSQDGNGVRWAIIDTDVMDTHSYFQGMSITRKIVTPQGVEPLNTAFSSSSGHGTHMAGIIHTIAPGAALVSIALDVRSRDPNNPRSPVYAKDIAHLDVALDWISKQSDIHGVNISMGISADAQDPLAGKGPGCKILNECVAAGKMVVVAAGNYGERGGEFREISITDPANAHSALVVGACETKLPETNGIWSGSSHGPTPDGRVKPDIVAPGVDIESCSHVDDFSFRTQSGTSQATAVVSGACAVLLSRTASPLLPDKLADLLKKTARDLNRLPTYQGAGVIRLDNAIQRLQQGGQLWPIQ